MTKVPKHLATARAEKLKAKVKHFIEERARCENSLYAYFLQAWKVLEPSTPLYTNWHLELFCEYLEEVTDGNILSLIINVPPRSLKSTIATVCWPTWQWGPKKIPHRRGMFASYSQSLSTEHSIARRKLIESDWYQARWGDVSTLTEDQNAKHYFKNNEGGHMFATSTGGTATGMGGEFVLVDDPHNTKQAESEAERTTTINDIDKGLMSRFNDPKTGQFILVMQRLHEDDVTGHILKKKLPGLVHVSLPTIAEKDETIVFPRSKRIVERKTGDLLHPDRIGPDEVAKMKLLLGSYGFAGQHQQRPAPLEGGLLKLANWRRWSEETLPTSFDEVIQSWDMRFKRTTTEQMKNKGDWVVGVVLGKKGAKLYLLDVVRGLWGFKDSRAAVVWLSDKWHDAVQKFVENKANGPGIVDDLEDNIPGLTLVEPKGDKMQRVQLTIPYQEAGNIYVPAEGYVFSDTGIGGAKPTTIDECLTEAAQFPNGGHDDFVDALTQGVLELQDSGLGYLRDMAGFGGRDAA